MYSRCIRLFNQLSKFCMKTEANISYLWNVHLMSTFVLCNLQMMSARYHILQKYPNWKTPKQKKKYAWPWRKRTGPLYLFCCRRTQFNLIELNLIEVDGSLWLMTHVWSRSYIDYWMDYSSLGYFSTDSVNIHCKRKPEYPEKTNYFLVERSLTFLTQLSWVSSEKRIHDSRDERRLLWRLHHPSPHMETWA